MVITSSSAFEVSCSTHLFCPPPKEIAVAEKGVVGRTSTLTRQPPNPPRAKPPMSYVPPAGRWMPPGYPLQDSYSISTAILSTALVLLALAVAVIVFLHLYLRHVLRCRLAAIDRLRDRAAITDADDPPPAVGLDPSAIAALPAFPFRRSSGSEEECSAADCAVCLGAAEEGEMVRLLPDCKHLFHVGCIDMWLGSHVTCPVCRAMVEPPPVTATLVRESSGAATSAQEGTPGSKEAGSVSSRLGASVRRMLSRERSTTRRAQGEATEDLERQ